MVEYFPWESFVREKSVLIGSLPMISPDGQYLSYLDEFTQTTKIMHIGKNADKCDEVLDLGFPTWERFF